MEMTEEQKFYAKARKYMKEMNNDQKKVFFGEIEQLKKKLKVM